MTAKVKKIIVDNLKNIEHIEMEANSTINFVAGNNGSGKTTLIESIFQAMDLKNYAKQADAWKLIKKDQDDASIKLHLQYNDMEVIVTRSFDKESGTKLKITTADGGSFPASFVSDWLWDFTIDPLAFSRMKPSEQIDVLKSIAGINTDEIDQQIQDTYDERRLASRTERELRAIVEKHADVEEVATKQSVSDLASERQEIMDHNAKIQEAKNNIQRSNTVIDEETQEIARMEQLIKEKKERIEKAKAYIKDQEPIASLELKPTDEIDAKIADIEANNEKAQKWESYQRQIRLHEESKLKAEWLDEKIEDLRSKKRLMFQEAGLPIDGLDFDDDGNILINNIPFAQYSSAEQIKISTELATHDKPELKVLYIKDGSLLDDESMDIITKIANDRDYQIFVEIVGEDDRRNNTIILRNGAVK